MKCSKCKKELKKIKVKIAGTKNKVISHQCPNCDYFEFETNPSRKVISKLKT